MASLNEQLYDVKRIAEHRVNLTDKKIQAIYEQLMKDLQSSLADTYKKYADNDGRMYMNYLDANRKKAAFLQQIVDNVDNLTPQLKDQMQTLIDDTYAQCYQGMSESFKKAYSKGEFAEYVKDMDVNPYQLEAAMQNNISKLTLPAVMEAHRAQITYQIMQELNIGLTNGDRYEKMAKRIEERVGVSRSKANNIVRTECHRNVESGFMDCAEHLKEGLDGSGLIYAATWHNMGDEKVRPQKRVKVGGKWVTRWSKNGANHMKMEGKTVFVGEKFDLGGGISAKAPSMSGDAKNDCNCRCFLEYNLMTAEEFAKATGHSAKEVRAKYGFTHDAVDKSVRNGMIDNGIVDLKLQETVEAHRFNDAIQAAKIANKNGGCVDTHPMRELKAYKLYLSDDNMAGVAVKPDGDITAVFKNSNSTAKGAVNDLIITARANGGVKMDCYGQYLANAYEKCGYEVVARVPFNPDYVSDPFLLKTKPDVYVLMKNTDDLDTVIKKNAANAYKLSTQEELDALPTFEYDDALKHRDDLLKMQKR